MTCLLIVTFLIVLSAANSIIPIFHLPIHQPKSCIVGGHPTYIERHPYQVSIQTFGNHFCGGSIITRFHILSAAHCVIYPADWITIHMGSRRKNGGKHYKISHIVTHEYYGVNDYGIPEYDICIIRLKKPIMFSPRKQPVSIFGKSDRVSEGMMGMVTGWGDISDDGLQETDILHVVHVPIVSKNKCSIAYECYGGVPTGQICAGYEHGGMDACQGDSGGPLIVNGRLAGIVSWGRGCAKPGYPGVYTEVSFYHGWIMEHTRIFFKG